MNDSMKSASFVVSNIPETTTRLELSEELTRCARGDGGGGVDIQYILYPLGDDNKTALVNFTKCPDDMVNAKARLSNELLTIKPAPHRTYNQCSAEVDAMVLAIIPDVPACLASLRLDFGIETSNDSGRVTLRGSLAQLTCAQNRLMAIHAQQCELQRTELKELELRSVQLKETEQKQLANKACNTDPIIPMADSASTIRIDRTAHETRSARDVPNISATISATTSVVADTCKHVTLEPNRSCQTVLDAGASGGVTRNADVEVSRPWSNVSITRKRSSVDERFSSDYLTGANNNRSITRAQPGVINPPEAAQQHASAFQQPRHPAKNLQEWAERTVSAEPHLNLEPPRSLDTTTSTQRPMMNSASHDPQHFCQSVRNTSQMSHCTQQPFCLTHDSQNVSNHHRSSTQQLLNRPSGTTGSDFHPGSGGMRNRSYASSDGSFPGSDATYRSSGYEEHARTLDKAHRDMLSFDDPRLEKTRREADRIMAELKQQREVGNAARNRGNYDSNQPCMENKLRMGGEFGRIGSSQSASQKPLYNDFMDSGTGRAYESMNEMTRRPFSGEDRRKPPQRSMDPMPSGVRNDKYFQDSAGGSEYTERGGQRWDRFDWSSFPDPGMGIDGHAIPADGIYRKMPNGDMFMESSGMRPADRPADPGGFDGGNRSVWQSSPANNRWRFSGERNVSSNNKEDMKAESIYMKTESGGVGERERRGTNRGGLDEDDRRGDVFQSRQGEEGKIFQSKQEGVKIFHSRQLGEGTASQSRPDELSQHLHQGRPEQQVSQQSSGSVRSCSGEAPLRREDYRQSSGFTKQDQRPQSSSVVQQHDQRALSSSVTRHDQRTQSTGVVGQDQISQSSGAPKQYQREQYDSASRQDQRPPSLSTRLNQQQSSGGAIRTDQWLHSSDPIKQEVRFVDIDRREKGGGLQGETDVVIQDHHHHRPQSSEFIRRVVHPHFNDLVRRDELSGGTQAVRQPNSNNNNEAEVTRDRGGGRDIAQWSGLHRVGGVSDTSDPGEKNTVRHGCDTFNERPSYFQPVCGKNKYDESMTRKAVDQLGSDSSRMMEYERRSPVMSSVTRSMANRTLESSKRDCGKYSEVMGLDCRARFLVGNSREQEFPQNSLESTNRVYEKKYSEVPRSDSDARFLIGNSRTQQLSQDNRPDVNYDSVTGRSCNYSSVGQTLNDITSHDETPYYPSKCKSRTDRFLPTSFRFVSPASENVQNMNTAENVRNSSATENVQNAYANSDECAESVSTVELDYFVTSYLMDVKSAGVSEICRRFDVDIRPTERIADDIVSVRFKVVHPGDQDQDVLRCAQKEFVRLYEDAFSRIVQQTVQITDDSVNIDNQLKLLREAFSDSLVVLSSHPLSHPLSHPISHLVLVGTYTAVYSAANQIQRWFTHLPDTEPLNETKHNSVPADITEKDENDDDDDDDCETNKSEYGEKRTARYWTDKEIKKLGEEMITKLKLSVPPSAGGVETPPRDSEFDDTPRSDYYLADDALLTNENSRWLGLVNYDDGSASRTDASNRMSSLSELKSSTSSEESSPRLEELPRNTATTRQANTKDKVDDCDWSVNAPPLSREPVCDWTENAPPSFREPAPDWTEEAQWQFTENLMVYAQTADITSLKVCAIVNAANSFLENHGGIARAIEDKGGEEFRQRCRTFIQRNGPLKPTEVSHTVSCGALLSDYVIHAVGPIWAAYSNKDMCASMLQETILNILQYADSNLAVQSIAIPAISTGIFEVPLDTCARAMFWAIHDFSSQMTSSSVLRSIYIINNHTEATDMFHAIFEQLIDAQRDTTTNHSVDARETPPNSRVPTNRSLYSPSVDSLDSTDSELTTLSMAERTGKKEQEQKKTHGVHHHNGNQPSAFVNASRYNYPADPNRNNNAKVNEKFKSQSSRLRDDSSGFSSGNYQFRPIERGEEDSDDKLSYASDSN